MSTSLLLVGSQHLCQECQLGEVLCAGQGSMEQDRKTRVLGCNPNYIGLQRLTALDVGQYDPLLPLCHMHNTIILMRLSSADPSCSVLMACL